MIPEAAVEAAAKELWDVNQHDDVWVDDFATYDDFLRRKARRILEAAAPHLMAPVLALADKWQEDFPDKARQLREAAGGNS